MPYWKTFLRPKTRLPCSLQHNGWSPQEALVAKYTLACTSNSRLSMTQVRCLLGSISAVCRAEAHD